ncbi:unnamed protein product, partial [Effrenium voratum]
AGLAAGQGPDLCDAHVAHLRGGGLGRLPRLGGFDRLRVRHRPVRRLHAGGRADEACALRHGGVCFFGPSGGNSLAVLRSAICGGPAGGEACGWAGQLCLRHLPEGLHRGRGAARAAGPGVGAAGEYAEVGHHDRSAAERCGGAACGDAGDFSGSGRLVVPGPRVHRLRCPVQPGKECRKRG